MKTIQLLFTGLFLLTGVLVLSAQNRNEAVQAKEVDYSQVPAAERQKAIQVQREVAAHFLQALAHSRSPQEYDLGRNSLARQLIPVIEELPTEEKIRIQERAMTILNDPGQRTKILGSQLTKLDFRKDILAQMGRTAQIRPEQQKKSVMPKSGTSNTATGKLKVRLKEVRLIDETNPEGGHDEIYLGAIFLDANEKTSKKDPFHIADFNEGDKKKEKKVYDPHYTLKTFDVNPNQNGQTFFTHFMLFEYDGTGTMYKVVDIALDWVAGALSTTTYGASVAIKLVIDVIVTAIAEDDQFPVFAHEIDLNAGTSDFTKNYWFWVKAHGGHYEVYFNWEYIAPAGQDQQALTASEQEPLPLGNIFKGDDGMVYYFREMSNKCYWYAEHPNGSMANLFIGARKGNSITGQWVSLPKGKSKSSGEISLEAQQTIIGPILKNVGRQSQDYPTTKWLPLESSAKMPGKGPAQFEGGIGNLDGMWTDDQEGIYYLRQIGNKLYWFGQEDTPSGTPGFAQIAEGTINGEKIAMNWWDVPKGANKNLKNGIVILQITNSNTLKNILGPDFSAKYLTRHADLVRPSCRVFETDQLTMEEKSRGHFIQLNGQALYSFYDQEEARKAFNFLTKNEITSACRIGEGKNRTTYFLSDGRAPQTQQEDWEVCSFFMLRNLEIRKTREGYILSAGRDLYLVFDSEAEANTMKHMIKKYGFSKYCKIGEFEYWR